MGDDNQQKPSRLPFTPIPVTPAKPTPTTKGAGKPKTKTYSKRKQIKRAKRTEKAPINIRRVSLGILLLLLVVGTATSILAPHKLQELASGEFIKKTETCTVTQTNSSNFFDTTCGKFEWLDELEPVTHPKDELVKGQTYTFESVGLRIGPAQVFPVVQSYTPAAAPQ